MYDMYPEWGPAKNRAGGDDGPRSRTTARSVQTSLDLRDNGSERPDDN